MRVDVFQAVVFLVVMLGGIAVLLLMDRRRARLVQAYYSSREELDEFALRALFDPSDSYSPRELTNVLGVVAKAGRVAPGRLRPTDRIESLCGSRSAWELGDDLLDLHEALHRLRPESRTSYRGVETIGDLVSTFFGRV